MMTFIVIVSIHLSETLVHLCLPGPLPMVGPRARAHGPDSIGLLLFCYYEKNKFLKNFSISVLGSILWSSGFFLCLWASEQKPGVAVMEVNIVDTGNVDSGLFHH